MKLAWATQEKFEDAEWIVFGVPDESGSHSIRKGTSKAPNKIRQVSNQRSTYYRGNKKFLVQPQQGTLKNNLYDQGNVKKEKVSDFVSEVVKVNKKPVMIGGDHSITFEALKGINREKKKR